MKTFILTCLLYALVFNVHAWSADHNYQVSLLRAAPGEMPALIDDVKAQRAALKNDMIIMRHSQGDHWDLMLLFPASKGFPQQTGYADRVSFQHDFLVRSTADWKSIRDLADDAGLFHIEMFQAAHARHQELLEQRVMENNYLEATQRKANLIFTTTFGNDVDLFTLGFYPDMLAFATEPDLPASVFEQAAVDAGFRSRSDIGFYLRKFLVAHQDTFATKVE